MHKIIERSEVAPYFKDGQTILYGGFLGTGTPAGLVGALLASGARDLTIVGNDTAFPDTGVGPLVINKRVRKVITSHIGTNPETGRQMIAGELDVELVPQGTLAERIRAGGAGIPAFYTPTSYGTDLAKGKPVEEFEGRSYVQERWLKADYALIKADTGDTLGNLTFRMAARNFAPLMATAAAHTIVQVTRLVEAGGIDPEVVVTPGIFVQKVVEVAHPQQEEDLNRANAVYPGAV